jgi:hypothetical protein
MVIKLLEVEYKDLTEEPWISVSVKEIAPENITDEIVDKEVRLELKRFTNNPAFEDSILQLRRQLKIPSTGYAPEKWLKNDILNEYCQKQDKHIKLPTDKDKYQIEVELLREYKIVPLMAPQLVNIVYANFMEIPIKKIQLVISDTNYRNLPEPHMQILIGGHSSVEEIKRFLTDNKRDIDAQLNRFYTPNIKTLSDKGIETYKRKTLGTETLVEIERERDEQEKGHGINTKDTLIDTDRIKKEFRRAKRKIESIEKDRDI